MACRGRRAEVARAESAAAAQTRGTRLTGLEGYRLAACRCWRPGLTWDHNGTAPTARRVGVVGRVLRWWVEREVVETLGKMWAELVAGKARPPGVLRVQEAILVVYHAVPHNADLLRFGIRLSPRVLPWLRREVERSLEVLNQRLDVPRVLEIIGPSRRQATEICHQTSAHRSGC